MEETYLYKINNFVLYKLEQIKQIMQEYTIINFPITTLLLNYTIFSNLIILLTELLCHTIYYKEMLFLYKTVVIYSIFIPLLPYINIDTNIITTVLFTSVNYNNNIFLNILNMLLGYFYSFILSFLFRIIPNGTFKIILGYGFVLTFFPIITTFFTIISPIVILFIVKVFLYLNNKLSNISPIISIICMLILKTLLEKALSNYIGYTFIALYISNLLNNHDYLIIYDISNSIELNYIINDIFYYLLITGLFYYLI